MMLGSRFGTIRLVVLLLSLSAQLYLFLSIRKAILSSGASDRSKARLSFWREH